jgi:putative transposase
LGGFLYSESRWLGQWFEKRLLPLMVIKNAFCYTKLRPDNCNKAKGCHPLMDNTNRQAYTKWICKYHIVFAPKYRRKVFFGEKKVVIGKILRQLCEWKEIKIIEAEICPDHVHMLLEIPPKVAVASLWGI